MTRTMIEAVGLHKSFGETRALAGLDFDVAEGTILAVLDEVFLSLTGRPAEATEEVPA
ncbi:MAG: hypothetical protein ACR2I5_06100 [Candidatus Limnocylindria bacterium]